MQKQNPKPNANIVHNERMLRSDYHFRRRLMCTSPHRAVGGLRGEKIKLNRLLADGDARSAASHILSSKKRDALLLHLSSVLLHADRPDMMCTAAEALEQLSGRIVLGAARFNVEKAVASLPENLQYMAVGALVRHYSRAADNTGMEELWGRLNGSHDTVLRAIYDVSWQTGNVLWFMPILERASESSDPSDRYTITQSLVYGCKEMSYSDKWVSLKIVGRFLREEEEAARLAQNEDEALLHQRRASKFWLAMRRIEKGKPGGC